jgi:hypothetical protein
MSAGRILLLAGAIASAGTLTACGGSNGPTEQQVAEIREAALREYKARQRERDAAKRLATLERELRRLSKPRAQPRGGGGSAPAAAPAASSGSSCGGGLSVNSVTSCPFAQNVAETYRGSGGASSIDVYSPVTNTVYTMSCGGGVPVVCSGGNGATVYIR